MATRSAGVLSTSKSSIANKYSNVKCGIMITQGAKMECTHEWIVYESRWFAGGEIYEDSVEYCVLCGEAREEPETEIEY